MKTKKKYIDMDNNVLFSNESEYADAMRSRDARLFERRIENINGVVIYAFSSVIGRKRFSVIDAIDVYMQLSKKETSSNDDVVKRANIAYKDLLRQRDFRLRACGSAGKVLSHEIALLESILYGA